MTVLLVALGAVVGAPTRYVVDRAIQSRHDWHLPWGTLTVNLAASLLLGLLAGLAVSPSAAALIGTGFCGALSTYSTFAFETVRLRRTGVGSVALVYTAASLAAGLAASALGYLAGTTLR